MHVLIIGAGGFIGRHIAGRLISQTGMQITLAGRDPARLTRIWPDAATLACDLARDDAACWHARLAGARMVAPVDAVINCAGLIGAGADYAGVHDRGAKALFDGCHTADVTRVIQISALGADRNAITPYHRSKGAADDHLAALDRAGTRMGWAVLRPSLVIGRGGGSTALFTMLASLPLVPRIGPGVWQVQPVAVEDLAEAVVRLLHQPGPLARTIDVVGPQPVSTDQLTALLRNWLGLRPAPIIPLPTALLRAVAHFIRGAVSRESLIMLAAGNCAPVAPFTEATGIAPLSPAQALARHPACPADLTEARQQGIAPLLRGLLALVWLLGGIVSLFFAPPALVSGWLAEVGLTGLPARLTLWAGSLADIAIALALMLRIPGAAMAGIALMAVFTAILTIAAPAVWADPFGPLVKNFAILGLSLAVIAQEKRHG